MTAGSSIFRAFSSLFMWIFWQIKRSFRVLLQLNLVFHLFQVRLELKNEKIAKGLAFKLPQNCARVPGLRSQLISEAEQSKWSHGSRLFWRQKKMVLLDQIVYLNMLKLGNMFPKCLRTSGANGNHGIGRRRSIKMEVFSWVSETKFNSK